MKFWLPILMIAVLTSGCAVQHNTPTTANPNTQIPPQTTIVFVDQNGSFYPKDWSKTYGEPPKNAKKNAYSLSKIASDRGKLSELENFEKQFLTKLQKNLKGDKRVFIFIHGYNSKYKDVIKDYKLIYNKLNLQKTDEVIQFFWDGLYSGNPLMKIKTWFTAVDNSQYAGKFGLRKILNVMSNKDIYLISHSRGASVMFSALSSAPIDTTKMSELAELHHLDTLQKEYVLRNRNNRIRAIALAPAIGKADFEIKKEDSDELEMVKFTPQLKTLHITTNKNDVMLRKFIGILSNKLNPTDLGYKGNSFEELSKQYSFLKRTDFSGQKSHDFTRYITNPKFNTITKTYKIAK